MALRCTVAADVFDIGRCRPNSSESYFVDSNAWLWTTYLKASQGRHPPDKVQTTYYPCFIASAIKAGATLYTCGISLCELAGQIERTEHFVYTRGYGRPDLKEFRHNLLTERKHVVAEVSAAWVQVKSMSSLLDVAVDTVSVRDALSQFGQLALDVADLYIVETMKKKPVTSIITDDCDFAVVPGLTVFTANQRVLDAARLQGKLRA